MEFHPVDFYRNLELWEHDIPGVVADNNVALNFEPTPFQSLGHLDLRTGIREQGGLLQHPLACNRDDVECFAVAVQASTPRLRRINRFEDANPQLRINGLHSDKRIKNPDPRQSDKASDAHPRVHIKGRCRHPLCTSEPQWKSDRLAKEDLGCRCACRLKVWTVLLQQLQKL